MSTTSEAGFSGDNGWRSRRGSCMARWTPVEIAAMVIGFAVYWPVGLAIVGLKVWQRRSGHQGDLATMAREKFDEARGRYGWQAPRWSAGGGFGEPSSGNAAFDEWRAAEYARLEEERRKLGEAQRAFEEHVANLRRAKDREEFDRFMSERRPS